MEKIVNVTAAWDRSHADPQKNYGISPVKLIFVLRGELGATQFVVSTGWFLDGRHDDKYNSYPHGADIGYHSPHPAYDGQDITSPSCEHLGGRPCYYDGTSLGAQDFMPEFYAGGSDAVWSMLEQRYVDVFGRLE